MFLQLNTILETFHPRFIQKRLLVEFIPHSQSLTLLTHFGVCLSPKSLGSGKQEIPRSRIPPEAEEVRLQVGGWRQQGSERTEDTLIVLVLTSPSVLAVPPLQLVRKP